MVDYKKAVFVGAVAGTVASFIFGRRTRALDMANIGMYAAGGAGVAAAGAWAMQEVGRPIGLLAAKGDFAVGAGCPSGFRPGCVPDPTYIGPGF